MRRTGSGSLQPGEEATEGNSQWDEDSVSEPSVVLGISDVPLVRAAVRTPPPSYKIWSIVNIALGCPFSLLCICWAVIALRYSKRTERHTAAGDIKLAQHTSSIAKTYNFVASVFVFIGMFVTSLLIAYVVEFAAVSRH